MYTPFFGDTRRLSLRVCTRVVWVPAKPLTNVFFSSPAGLLDLFRPKFPKKYNKKQNVAGNTHTHTFVNDLAGTHRRRVCVPIFRDHVSPKKGADIGCLIYKIWGDMLEPACAWQGPAKANGLGPERCLSYFFFLHISFFLFFSFLFISFLPFSSRVVFFSWCTYLPWIRIYRPTCSWCTVVASYGWYGMVYTTQTDRYIVPFSCILVLHIYTCISCVEVWELKIHFHPSAGG